MRLDAEIGFRVVSSGHCYRGSSLGWREGMKRRAQSFVYY